MKSIIQFYSSIWCEVLFPVIIKPYKRRISLANLLKSNYELKNSLGCIFGCDSNFETDTQTEIITKTIQQNTEVIMWIENCSKYNLIYYMVVFYIYSVSAT